MKKPIVLIAIDLSLLSNPKHNVIKIKASIKISENWEYEISHHYGLERFREFGAILIDIINREYCKKLIVQLPRQKHPYHFHKIKKETFQVLHGELSLEVEGSEINLTNGEMYTVIPEQWHKFDTMDGVIFEEISTKAIDGDSYYDDNTIAANRNRKTIVEI